MKRTLCILVVAMLLMPAVAWAGGRHYRGGHYYDRGARYSGHGHSRSSLGLSFGYASGGYGSGYSYGLSYGYGYGGPVYRAPYGYAPVVVAPPPVYCAPRVYYPPAPVYYAPQPVPCYPPPGYFHGGATVYFSN
jgi:hypothetical protein